MMKTTLFILVVCVSLAWARNVDLPEAHDDVKDLLDALSPGVENLAKTEEHHEHNPLSSSSSSSNGKKKVFEKPELFYTIAPPDFSLLEPQGLRMAIPHEDGITLFAVHYSINKPLVGVGAGDYNFDVTSPTGDEWVHENTAIVVSVGDVVNYWTLVMHNGRGHQLTDQSWTATGTTGTTTGEPTEEPTTTTSTTVKTTTPSDGGGDTTTTTANDITDATTTSGGIGPRPTDPPSTECTEYPCLIFEDNFDTLDFKKWTHEITAGGGGNWEFQYYTNNRSNSYTRDGTVFLKPTLTSDKYGEAFLSSGLLDIYGMAPANLCSGAQYYGCLRAGTAENYINPVQSARLRTVGKFAFRYGKVEVSAQMPRGDWLWPAIWLLPTDEEYGGWPASGEIDIVESRGNDNLKDEAGTSVGNDHMGTTMHWGPYFPLNGYAKTATTKNGDFGHSFHKYMFEWDENEFLFYLDDELILTVDPGDDGFWDYGDFGLDDSANPWVGSTNKLAPFDKEFYLVMNVAVGGTNGFFSDSWTPAKPWHNTSPTALRDFWQAKNQWYPTWNPDTNNGEDAALKLDYIRVWKTKADPTS